MSGESVKKVIARAVSDAGFRELLFRDPDGALAEYGLTEQEKESILAGLSREGFDALSSELGERTSRAGIHLGDVVGEIAEEIDPRPIIRDGGAQDEIAQVDAVEEGSVLPLPMPDPADEPESVDDLAGSLPLPMPGPAGEDRVTPVPIPDPGGELEPVEDLAGTLPLPLPLPDPAAEPGIGGIDEVGKIDSFTLEADDLGAAPAGPEVGDVGVEDVIDYQDGDEALTLDPGGDG